MNPRKKPNKPAPKANKVGTTGHNWDGIKELNNPLPRWWLWTFYATIIWGIGYMVVYPSVPLLTSATQGTAGYSSRLALEEDLAHFAARNAPLDEALIAIPLTEIQANPDLAHYASAGGAAVFKTACAQCHGEGAEGAKGYPNLLDDDWLWGGDIEAIYQSIRHGIGAEDDINTRFAEMSAFGEFLSDDEMTSVLHYTLSLSGAGHNPSFVGSGASVFADNCAACHGADGKGDRALGAPDLTDSIWLYGKSQSDVRASITEGRQGKMPAWQHILSEAQLRQVAYFVHQLGGGE